MRRLLLPVFLLGLFASGVWAETKTVDPFVMPSARFNALGGRHVTMADDFYAIFLNPAGFADVKDQFSAAEITISTFGPTFEIIDLLREGSGDVEDIDLSGLVGPGGLSTGVDVGGPLSLGWVGRGFGLGIFSSVKAIASINGAYFSPKMTVDLFFAGGYGFRLINKNNNILDAGFLAKGFFRGTLDMKTTVFSIDSLDPDDSPFNTNLGFGLDLGIRYTFADNFSFAVVCYDVYSPVLFTSYDTLSDFFDGKSQSSSYATVKRRLDFGVNYRIRSAFLDRYISRFTIMLDYHDLLDLFELLPRNAILNAGLGIEVVLLKALTFRFGLADALPAVGFGLDLKFMTLDFAVFGKELGLDPGKHPVYAMSVGLLFRY